jgi:hypothetical protein
MIQAVTSVEAAVQLHVSPHGIYSTKSGTGIRFPLSNAGFLSIIPPMLHIHSFIHISVMLDNLSSSQHHYVTYLSCSFICYQNTTYYYSKIFQYDECSLNIITSIHSMNILSIMFWYYYLMNFIKSTVFW